MFPSTPAASPGQASKHGGNRTINTGNGRSERRIQVYVPTPLPLSSATTTREAFGGVDPTTVFGDRGRVDMAPTSPKTSTSNIPFAGSSTSRTLFAAPALSAYKERAGTEPQFEQERLSVPLQGTSTTRSTFQKPYLPSAWDSRQQENSQTRTREKLPFEGLSTTKSTYLAPPVEASTPAQRSESNVPDTRGKPLPLLGESTTRSMYRGIDQSAYSPLREDRDKSQGLAASASPRRGDTRLIEGDSETSTSATRGASAPINRVPFAGHSTTRSTYTPPQRDVAYDHGLAQTSFPAQVEPFRSLPLNGTSTTRSAYASPGRDAYNSTPNPVPLHADKAYFVGDTAGTELEQKSNPKSIPLHGESTTNSTYLGVKPAVQEEAGRDLPQRLSRVDLQEDSNSASSFRAPDLRSYTHDPMHETRSPVRRSLPLEGTSETRARFAGWSLPEHRPALGLQAFGDTFVQVVPESDAGVAMEHKVIVTTCADAQEAVELRILQRPRSTNEGLRASDCELLGAFELMGIQSAPCAVPQIEVHFKLSAQGILHVSARDLLHKNVKTWIAIDRTVNASAFAQSSV